MVTKLQTFKPHQQQPAAKKKVRIDLWEGSQRKAFCSQDEGLPVNQTAKVIVANLVSTGDIEFGLWGRI